MLFPHEKKLLERHSSFGGRDWRNSTQNYGTGTVTFPDAKKEIEVWAKGRSKDSLRRPDWIEYAERQGVPPEEAQSAWEGFVGCSLKTQEAIDELKKVFEGVSWTGFYGPNPLSVASQSPTSLPFRSEVAPKVFDKATALMSADPRLQIQQAILQAIDVLQLTPGDLTPEDIRLIEMGLEQWQNGNLGQTPPKTGGTPGGPFRSSPSDAFVPRRGAP